MNKKLVKGLGLTGVVVAGAIAINCITFANSQVLLGGMAKWKGGEANGKVYSKLIDEKNDNYRIYGRVSVSNDWNQTNYSEGFCKGVGESNCLKASINKGVQNPFVTSKSNYSKVRSEQGSY